MFLPNVSEDLLRYNLWTGIDLRIKIYKHKINGISLCGMDLCGPRYGKMVDFCE
jgi:hypothetical protein